MPVNALVSAELWCEDDVDSHYLQKFRVKRSCTRILERRGYAATACNPKRWATVGVIKPRSA